MESILDAREEEELLPYKDRNWIRERYGDNLSWLLCHDYDGIRLPYILLLQELKRKFELLKSGEDKKLWKTTQFESYQDEHVQRLFHIFDFAIYLENLLFFQLFKYCVEDFNSHISAFRPSDAVLKLPHMIIPLVTHRYIPIDSSILPLLQNMIDGVKWNIQRSTKISPELIDFIIEYM